MTSARIPGGRVPGGVSAKERALLEKLEVIRRSGERVTITEFARRVGYKHKNALRRYPTLREALHRYCVQQPGRRHLASPRADLAERARRDKALAAREREIKRLEAALAKAEAHMAKQRGELEALATVVRERDALRGMVSALVAQMAQRSAVRAPEIERDLLAIAAAHVEGPPSEPSPLPEHRASEAHVLRQRTGKLSSKGQRRHARNHSQTRS